MVATWSDNDSSESESESEDEKIANLCLMAREVEQKMMSQKR